MKTREDIMGEAREEAGKAAIVEMGVALIDEATAPVRARADRLEEALKQAVSWIEECGSDYEGRQFVLTEARAALKGISLAKR